MLKILDYEGASPKQWYLTIEGMRNPFKNRKKNDSLYSVYHRSEDGGTYAFTEYEFIFGNDDLNLAKVLANAGPDHGKFLRELPVIIECRAPLYWWKQLDSYRVCISGMSSESTMHTIHKKPFEMSDFSLDEELFDGGDYAQPVKTAMESIINNLNNYRDGYLETKDKRFWRAMIELLPESYYQTRTFITSYAGLRTMYGQRIAVPHVLPEWSEFFNQLQDLPYYNELIVGNQIGIEEAKRTVLVVDGNDEEQKRFLEKLKNNYSGIILETENKNDFN